MRQYLTSSVPVGSLSPKARLYLNVFFQTLRRRVFVCVFFFFSLFI